MARKVKQFRYYGEDDDHGSAKNQPSGCKMAEFINGNIFSSYYPIVQLGIQAMPGAKFYINVSDAPIIIGQTGIYELDLNGKTEISHLYFYRESMEQINELNNALLIVDIVYDDGTVEV